MSHTITNPNDVASFLTAGKAVLTLKSQKTGDHLTYKVQRNKRGNGSFFVSVKDLHDYIYIGMMFDNNGSNVFHTTAKSAKPKDSTESKTFSWFLKQVNARCNHPHLEVRHEDQCGRCGRALIDPVSIDRGIGPECIKKM
jgi:hypothetical protein